MILHLVQKFLFHGIIMKKIKILVVEDETIIALDIKNSIEDMGFEVIDYVCDFNGVCKVLQKQLPDIILMDINLEESIDGIQISQNIQKYKIPIIYLTAYTDEKTISRAIKTEPIGYIVKPFNDNELKATILLGIHKLQKEKNLNNNYLHLGDSYYFDKIKKELFFNNVHINLSKREKNLLILLIEAKGNIISFIDLEREIWEDIVTNSALRVLIFRLRCKLEHKFIETISGEGCRLILNN